MIFMPARFHGLSLVEVVTCLSRGASWSVSSLSVSVVCVAGLVAKETEGVYSATEKETIRNHVAYVCRKQHCADTLVLYLNSPTWNDGTMLLWDRNHNGIVSGRAFSICRRWGHCLAICVSTIPTGNRITK